ncbi:MAG: hypothetical protein V7K97_12860 [Nostoc sp.]|uniref:hypothetical protein n=1 Tax=Nostoc sp. TaxID=1180 RepID=UPI002FF65A88
MPNWTNFASQCPHFKNATFPDSQFINEAVQYYITQKALIQSQRTVSEKLTLTCTAVA